MYELTVSSGFSAAHNLREYEGRCERLHGHNYEVEASFTADKLAENGLAVDFGVLKKALKKALDELDHKYLNDDVGFFQKNNPSAENIAFFIHEMLKKNVKEAKVSKVSVWESSGAKASYYE